jgi:hypothetical protein
MSLRTVLVITIALWIVLVAFLGYWQLIFAWRWGNGAIFLLHSLPLATLSLIAILTIEIILLRPRR